MDGTENYSWKPNSYCGVCMLWNPRGDGYSWTASEKCEEGGQWMDSLFTSVVLIQYLVSFLCI